MDQRLVAIELKLTALEDTVKSLNEQVYAQGRQLDELRALCRMLIQRVEDQDTAASGGLAANERPPHY